MAKVKIVRTTLNIEHNKDTDGFDVVIRLGSLRLEQEACELATLLVLQNGLSFEHSPEHKQTLH